MSFIIYSWEYCQIYTVCNPIPMFLCGLRFTWWYLLLTSDYHGLTFECTYYRLSSIKFQKEPVTDFLGMNFKRYLLSLTISVWIPKATCHWLSRIEFQKIPVTDYLGFNSKRYLLLTISDWLPKGTYYRLLDWIPKAPVTHYLVLKVPFIDYLGFNSKRYLLLTISDSISKGTWYWLSRF